MSFCTFVLYFKILGVSNFKILITLVPEKSNFPLYYIGVKTEKWTKDGKKKKKKEKKTASWFPSHNKLGQV